MASGSDISSLKYLVRLNKINFTKNIMKFDGNFIGRTLKNAIFQWSRNLECNDIKLFPILGRLRWLYIWIVVREILPLWPGDIGPAVISLRVVVRQHWKLQHFFFVFLKNVNPASHHWNISIIENKNFSIVKEYLCCLQSWRIAPASARSKLDDPPTHLIYPAFVHPPRIPPL